MYHGDPNAHLRESSELRVCSVAACVSEQLMFSSDGLYQSKFDPSKSSPDISNCRSIKGNVIWKLKSSKKSKHIVVLKWLILSSTKRQNKKVVMLR